MVDLNYPSNLHDGHNDFPLAAEKLKFAFSVSSRIGKQDQSYPKASGDASFKAKLCMSLFSSEILLSTGAPSNQTT